MTHTMIQAPLWVSGALVLLAMLAVMYVRARRPHPQSPPSRTPIPELGNRMEPRQIILRASYSSLTGATERHGETGKP